MTLERPSLVLAAHGSRDAAWTEAVSSFAGDVAARPGVARAFASVRAAFLERSVPTLLDAVRGALQAGSPRVVVIPLFLTASTHVREDVVALLGRHAPPRARHRLVDAGRRPLAPGSPVALVSLGSIEGVLVANVCRRVGVGASAAGEDGVVLCAYGSSRHHAQWEALLGAVGRGLLACGFGYVGHAYIGHGAGRATPSLARSILAAAAAPGVRRVHVVPLLLGTSASLGARIDAAVREAAAATSTAIFARGDAILPDSDLAAHVAARALGAR